MKCYVCIVNWIAIEVETSTLTGIYTKNGSVTRLVPNFDLKII